MRVLLVCTSFNSLTQRLHVVLREHGHEISVEFDTNDQLTSQAVELFEPDVVIAPFLRRRLPEAVFERRPTMIVHPGPPGDRGPNALDWAILEEPSQWGVTILEAAPELDAGRVWAHRNFPLRQATKSSLYRREVGDAAIDAVLEALGKLEAGERPVAAETLTGRAGQWRGVVDAKHRTIDWTKDDTANVLRKIRASDGQPGAQAELGGSVFRLFDAHEEPALGIGASRPRNWTAGEVIGHDGKALLIATTNGGIWAGALKPKPTVGNRGFKRPATIAWRGEGHSAEPSDEGPFKSYCPIRYRQEGDVGFLQFDFYNGAMTTDDCLLLRQSFMEAARGPAKVIVLEGGSEFWSNGIHLGAIEAAASPADESMANIEAMDDLVEAILRTSDKIVISALGANAGAGGFFLALAADRVVARNGVIFNPHYKNMGNLYGSEYWTYILPRRVGADGIPAVMAARLPMGTSKALKMGLIDEVIDGDRETFAAKIATQAAQLAAAPDYDQQIESKAARLALDEAQKPLAAYRDEELTNMHRNFYGFDPSYHIARYNFITKVPLSHTPRHLAVHRRG